MAIFMENIYLCLSLHIRLRTKIMAVTRFFTLFTFISLSPSIITYFFLRGILYFLSRIFFVIY